MTETATKPKVKLSGKKVEPSDPAYERRRFERLSGQLGKDNGGTVDRVFGKIVPPNVREKGKRD